MNEKVKGVAEILIELDTKLQSVVYIIILELKL